MHTYTQATVAFDVYILIVIDDLYLEGRKKEININELC